MAKMENAGKHGIGPGSEQPPELPAVCEQVLKSEQLRIDRKTLVLTLKKNRRGDYKRCQSRQLLKTYQCSFPNSTKAGTDTFSYSKGISRVYCKGC